MGSNLKPTSSALSPVIAIVTKFTEQRMRLCYHASSGTNGRLYRNCPLFKYFFIYPSLLSMLPLHIEDI